MLSPEHQRLLEEIADGARRTRSYTGRGRFSEAVMEAMAAVPRHSFVDPRFLEQAYVNAPLPIGLGQTISQPYIVALMTDMLDLTGESRVLEVGTGCGYQSAVLAEVAGQVYSIEVIETLSNDAGQTLKRLGYENVTLTVGNGYFGWPEYAPYDGILVTAAGETVPPALIDQLCPGGRMVIPVGEVGLGQELLLVKKHDDGSVNKARLLSVSFVPLIGSREHGIGVRS